MCTARNGLGRGSLTPVLKKRGGSTSGDTFISKISEMHRELDATAPATGWIGKTATATVTTYNLTDDAPCGSKTLEATRSATPMGGSTVTYVTGLRLHLRNSHLRGLIGQMTSRPLQCTLRRINALFAGLIDSEVCQDVQQLQISHRKCTIPQHPFKTRCTNSFFH